MVLSPQELVIGCAVSDTWAGGQCKRVVERAGARLVNVSPEHFDLPLKLNDFAACIYDLAPWDAEVPLRLQRLRTMRPEMPILLYLPPSPSAVAMVPDCVRLANVRCRMQLRVWEEVHRFEEDTNWLLRSVPVQCILAKLAESVPDAEPIVHAFSRVVLRRLSVGLRCTVAAIGRDLGISSRTLQRHLGSNSLGMPKQLIDRLTLWYVLHLAETGNVSLARASRTVRISPNDLYKLKKRVAQSIELSKSRDTWHRMMGDSLATMPLTSDPELEGEITVLTNLIGQPVDFAGITHRV